MLSTERLKEIAEPCGNPTFGDRFRMGCFEQDTICGRHFGHVACTVCREGQSLAMELLQARIALMEISKMTCKGSCGRVESAATIAEDALGGYTACRALIDVENEVRRTPQDEQEM